MSDQTVYRDMLKGYPGQRVGLRAHKSSSYVNSQGNERQVDDVIVDNALNSTAYAFTVDGYAVNFTSPASGTTVAIVRDGLIAAYRSIQELETVASVNPNPAGTGLRVTSKQPGVGYTLAESDANLSTASIQANVAQVPIPFGLAVVQGSTDEQAVLPSAGGQNLLGVVERIHSNVDPSNAGTGNTGQVSFGQDMSIGHEGTWLVLTEVAVDARDPVFFRHTAPGTEQVGAWRNDNDGGNADAAPNCVFKTSTTGPGLAELQLNLPG